MFTFTKVFFKSKHRWLCAQNWDKLSCLRLYIFISFWGNERRQNQIFRTLCRTVYFGLGSQNQIFYGTLVFQNILVWISHQQRIFLSNVYFMVGIMVPVIKPYHLHFSIHYQDTYVSLDEFSIPKNFSPSTQWVHIFYKFVFQLILTEWRILVESEF